MADSTEEEASHGDMDHGLGNVDALLVVAHQPPPSGEPAEGSLDDPATGQDLEAGFGIDAADDLDDEVEEGGLVHELVAIIGPIGEQMLDPRPVLADASRIIWAPALSEMSAGVRLTISRRPSVSTTTWRLRPTVFLAAS